MTSELRDCPFCGGEARLFDASGTRFKPAVTCMDCAAAVPARTRDTAITAWNTRAKADQIMGVEGDAEAALAALKAEVVEVVEPFANAWAECEAKTPNHMPRQQDLGRFVMSTDFRAARDLLAKLQGEG
jgi:Lar family restriction alleviation protein